MIKVKLILILVCFFTFISSSIFAENLYKKDAFVKEAENKIQNTDGEKEEEEEEEEEDKGPWFFSGEFSQVFNQSSFTNWAAGGEDSYSSTSLVGLEANYKKERFAFENNLDLRYGLYKMEDQSLKKNEDRIDFNSKVGRDIVEKLSYSAMLNYRSQFTAGYNYPNDSVVVSRFMAPGFLTTSIGIDYKPWEFLSVFISPVAGRFTFVLDDELSNKGAFGVDTADNVNIELGGMLTLTFDNKFTDNIRVRSRFEVFNTYKDPDMEGWLNSIVNWESTVRVKITDYITVNLMFHLIYDQNIAVPVYETIDGQEIKTGEEHLQFMQAFGLGLSYSF